MSNYIKRPEPGRHNKKEIKETVTQQEKIDVNILAKAIIEAMNGNNSIQLKKQDDFDNSKTLSKIAEQMIVERGTNHSNLDNIGNIVETRKNNNDVQNTIDLLKNLNN